MYQNFDFWNRHEIPMIWLCNPDKSKIGSLKPAFDINLTLRFNQTSEMTLSFPKHIESTRLDIYDSIESKRLIFIENLGYFLIHGIVESDDGIQNVKTVTAYSLECELGFKKVNLISGTHQFWNPTNPSSSLLGKVFDAIPSWSVEHVDVELWDLWRTFEVPDATVYDFLVDTVEKSYECVFGFDSFNKTVSVYTLANATNMTDIYMSFDTLIHTIEVEELSDEIVTALKVYGDSELDISGVNPVGTPTIYNFDYYKNTQWMSQGLINAINIWEQKIQDNTASYKTALLDIKTANERLYIRGGTSTNEQYTTTVGDGSTVAFTITHNLGTTCPAVQVRYTSSGSETTPQYYAVIYNAGNPNAFQIFFTPAPAGGGVEVIVRNVGLYTVQATVQATYDSLMQIKGARIDAGQNFADINVKLDQANDQLVVINNAINAQVAIVDSRTLTLQNINSLLKMENNFTPEQLVELDPFIIENTYQNTAFIKTETMTLVEEQDMQEQLLAQGQSILERVSTPRYTFSVDSANFLFLKEFQQFSQQLQLGSIVNIRVSDSLVATPILLQLEYTLDNPENFTMTFGNRHRLDDSAYIFSDLFNDAINSGVSSNFNQELWQKFVNSGADVALNDLLTEAWDAAKNEIINSANQQIIIDGAGLRGKMQNTDGSYDPHQVWLTGKSLAFTRDNWDTVSLALGEIQLGGTKYYGLAAEAVVGQLLAGSQLIISNGVRQPDGSVTNTTFSVDASGMHATAGDFSFTANNQLGRIIYNGTDGFRVQGRVNASAGWNNLLYVDTAGNLQVSGNGSFTGNIYANGGYFTGELRAATGTFTGTLTAGRVESSNIIGNYISGGTIEGNTITGNTINGGTISGTTITGTTINGNTITGGTISGTTGTFSGNLEIGSNYVRLASDPVAKFGNFYINTIGVWYGNPNPDLASWQITNSADTVFIYGNTQNVEIGAYRRVNITGDIYLSNPANQGRIIVVNAATATGGQQAMFVDRTGDLGGWSLGRLTSSIKYKKNIEEYPTNELLEICSKLTPITYQGIEDSDDSQRRIGFIAEDVNKFITEVVNYHDGEPDSLMYGNMSAIAIGAIKELTKRIEVLEDRIKGE